MRRYGPLSVILLGALTACGYKGPSLAGHEGLGYQVKSYYDSNAIEQGGSCNAPEMSIAGHRVFEETPERLTVAVRYYWQDDRYAVEDPFTGASRSFGVGSCSGFGERVFTVAKRSDGSTEIVEMSGARRGR